MVLWRNKQAVTTSAGAPRLGAAEKRRQAVGIDLGASCLKSIVVAVRQGSPAVLACHRLQVREEGILNDADLYSSLAAWLQQTGCAGLEATVGLPQYLATTQVSDFAQGASDAALEDMVAFETRQLAGLSEESFVHDFHVLSPGGGRRNPVLIGICRESVIRERMAALQAVGIRAPHLAMSGLAAANSFLALHPEALAEKLPQLVVDIGRDNSTVVVLAGGQPLFVGSLLFGADKFARAAMEREGIPEAAADAHLATVTLEDESPRSAYIQCARLLQAEIEDAIGHWRAQERDELAKAPIAQLWLCGGGARLQGLDAYLADGLSCRAAVFGPVHPETGALLPEMSVAHGLALQALGAAPVAISLTPPEVRLAAHREKRFGLLVAACLAVGLMLGVQVVRSVQGARVQVARVGEDLRELAECEKLIPRLEEARRAIERGEASLIPLVQAGNRSRHWVRTIDALGAACGEGDWFVYLGDEASYHRGRPGAEASRPRSDSLPGASAFPGGGSRPVVGDAGSGPEFPRRVLAREAPGLDALIAAGYVPLLRYQPWEPVRTLIQALRATGIYREVDTLPETERVGREDIFAPWVKFFGLHGNPHTPFSLRLSLAAPEVTPVPPEAEPAGRSP